MAHRKKSGIKKKRIAFCGHFDIEIIVMMADLIWPVRWAGYWAVVTSSYHLIDHFLCQWRLAKLCRISKSTPNDSFRLSRRLKPPIILLRQRLKTPLFLRSLSESSRHYGDLTQLHLFTTSTSTPSSPEEPAILWFVPLPRNELPVGGANEPKYNFCALQTLLCSCLSSVPTPNVVAHWYTAVNTPASISPALCPTAVRYDFDCAHMQGDFSSLYSPTWPFSITCLQLGRETRLRFCYQRKIPTRVTTVWLSVNGSQGAKTKI